MTCSSQSITAADCDMIAPECTQPPSGAVKMTSRRRCVQAATDANCARSIYIISDDGMLYRTCLTSQCVVDSLKKSPFSTTILLTASFTPARHALREPIGVHGSKDGRTQDVKSTACSPWRSFTRTFKQKAQRHISQLRDCHATAHARPYLLTCLQRASLVVEHACTVHPLRSTTCRYSLHRSYVPCAPLSSTVVQCSSSGARSQCTSCASVTGVRSVCRSHAQVVIAGCMHDASIAAVWLCVLLGIFGQTPPRHLFVPSRWDATTLLGTAFHTNKHFSDKESTGPANALQSVAYRLWTVSEAR
jgi:hypothetical protein